MKKLIKDIASIGLGIAVLLGAGMGSAYLAYATTLRVVQTPTIHLYTGISASATSARVTPFPKDLDGNKLTITDFGSSPTFTVDPKVSNYEEIIGFTGITDNGDNTATLTGLSRNLTSKYPYTTAGTGRIHGAGATVVFGNNPQIYGRLSAKENDEWITGVWGFAALPTTTVACTSPYQFCNKAYMDALTITGAPTSTEISLGTSVIAPSSVLGLSTASTTAGAPYVIQNKFATTTPQNCTSLPCIPVTSSGVISAQFIATSSTYRWSGAHTFASTTIYTLNVDSITATSTATSTFNGYVSGVYDYQVFTGSGTWTKPANLTGNEMVYVQAWGAGGGGGHSGASGTNGGGGGGGGACLEHQFRASDLTATVTVTVGTGAAATVGGNTTFGAYLTAYGGGAGQTESGVTNASPGGGGGGALGVGSVGTADTTGGSGGSPGGAASTASNSGWGGAGGGVSGGGGSSAYGGAGGGGAASSAGGSNPGGNAVCGGGGGASGGGTGSGGTSVFGGNGGAASANAVGGVGSAPGGGGAGGSYTSGGQKLGGAGGRGEVRVWLVK